MPADPKQIMHANELNSWLKPYASLSGQNVDGVMADIVDIWRQEGQLLDSGELSVKLADKYLSEKGITAEAKAQILTDIHDIEALKREADHTTGVLKKDHKGVETALSHVYAQETGRPVMMLEFDFGNMGGTNELFQKKFAIEKFQKENGHASFTEAESAFKGLASDEQKRLIDEINIKQTFDKTDTAAKIVTQTVVTDLEANFPDNKVIAIRTGGDELRFIVEGVDPSKYDDIIMATTHNVEIKMAELGLLDHEHAKGRDNIFKNGFGGGLAAEDMRNITDPDNIIAMMDEDVKAHKDSIGEVRANQHINITETVKRNMGIAAETDITALPADQQRAFDLAVEQQKTYLEKNAENIRAHAPSPTQTIAEFDTRAAEILASVDKTPSLDVNNPTLKSADVDDLKHGQFATIEDQRVAYMEQRLIPEYIAANGGHNIDPTIEKFMATQARSLNPMDPSANVNTVSDYRQNAQIWYDASVPDARPSTMFVGFQNLGGLNNLLGHDGADAVLKDMSSIVTSSLNEAGIDSDKFVIAHNGGGEFRLVIQPGYEDQLKTANASITEKTAALNSSDISTYLAGKGIELDDNTQKKIAGRDFTSIEDPKVRETHIGEQKIQGYADGLAVITTSSEMEIAPGNTAKAWDVDHILSAQKQSLDDATENFRHQEILAYHNISDPTKIDPNKEYTAQRLGTDTTTPEATNKPRLTESFDDASKPPSDAPSARMNGLTQMGAGSAGLGMSVVGMKNAIDRGDTTGIVVSGTDMAVSSADTIMDGSPMLGKTVSEGLRGAAMKANIAVTLVDGVYQISQEEGLENQIARGTAVTLTTTTALGVGAVATTVVTGGALTTAAVVTAPIACAVAVGLAADAGVNAFKAQNAFEERIAHSEQGVKTGNVLEDSGAPALQNYQNLRAFAIVEASDPDGKTDLTRQQIALKATEYEYSRNPEALDVMEMKIQAKIDEYDKVIEENDSWVPDFTRVFGQDEVQTKMQAQIERTQYVAAMNELKEYREELSEYNKNQANYTHEQKAEHRDGLSSAFDNALENENADIVSSSPNENNGEGLTARDIDVSNSIVSQNGDNMIHEDNQESQRTTTYSPSSFTNIAP